MNLPPTRLNHSRSRLLRPALTACVLAVAACAGLVRANEDGVGDPARADEFNAVILAQGAGQDGLIAHVLSAKIVEALRAIRAKHPEVAAIQARPAFDPEALLVSLSEEGGELLKRRLKMTTDEEPPDEPIEGGTGIRRLDEFNAKLGVASVSAFGSTRFLLIRFKEPKDIPALIKLYNAIPEIMEAEGDPAWGDGDDIHLKRSREMWWFAFKHGWGDCPAGCVHNRFWFFAYHPQTKQIVKTGEHQGRINDPDELWRLARGAGE